MSVLAAQQQVQQALENQPLHVHRLGHQLQLAQSPAVQAISATKGLSFLDVTDKDILRLTRPAGTYQQLVQRFQERYGESLDGRLRICFLTNENLADGLYPLPLRHVLDAEKRFKTADIAEVSSEMRQNKAAHFDFGRHEYQISAITVEQPRGNVGLRMNHLSDEAEPYTMGVTQSKLLRSRSLFLTAQIGHEIGHAVYDAEGYGLEDENSYDPAYIEHIDECYADAMSVYITAQMQGQRGLDYVRHDRHLRALSLQNDAKYYTCPVMDAAIAHAQELLDSGDLKQHTLLELGEMVEEVWYEHIPSAEEFAELTATQQEFVAAIDRAGNVEDVQHPMRAICEEAWAGLSEEFEPAEELPRQQALQQYYSEVSQSLRGYGSREKQLEALQAIEYELTEEADLNQQLMGRDDLDLDELEPGELQIAERRTVVQRLHHVIEQSIQQPAHSR